MPSPADEMKSSSGGGFAVGDNPPNTSLHRGAATRQTNRSSLR